VLGSGSQVEEGKRVKRSGGGGRERGG